MISQTDLVNLLLGNVGVLVALMVALYILYSGKLIRRKDYEDKAEEVARLQEALGKEREARVRDRQAFWEEQIKDARETKQLAESYIQLRRREGMDG